MNKKKHSFMRELKEKKKEENRRLPSLLNAKKGGLMDMPVNLLVLFISITFLVCLIPGLVQIINTAKQSNALNCAGYNYQGNPLSPLSYNSSLESSSIACMAINLQIPYIVLGVLIAGVALIFYGRQNQGGQQMGAY